jgi:hypothetical protein
MSRLDELNSLSNLDKLVLIEQLHDNVSDLAVGQEQDKLYEHPVIDQEDSLHVQTCLCKKQMLASLEKLTADLVVKVQALADSPAAQITPQRLLAAYSSECRRLWAQSITRIVVAPEQHFIELLAAMHKCNVQPAKKTTEEILSAELPILPMTVDHQNIWEYMPNELLFYSVVNGDAHSLHTYPPKALDKIIEVFSEIDVDARTRLVTTLSELVKLEEQIVNQRADMPAFKMHTLLLASIANADLSAVGAQQMPMAFSAETLCLINANPARFFETATCELEAMPGRYSPALVAQSRGMLASIAQLRASTTVKPPFEPPADSQ